MNKITPEQVLEALKIEVPILNIYQYGSRVYGCNKTDADFDFIIVTKSLCLPSGAFRQNAISSESRLYQGTLFGRSGFIDAINNYEMSVWECLSLPEEFIVKKTIDFKPTKWNEKEMVKKVITKASNSFHIADLQAKDYQTPAAKKGTFQALRILMFGLQLKKYQKIVDYSEANYLREKFDAMDDDDFDTRDYMKMRDELIEELRSGN